MLTQQSGSKESGTFSSIRDFRKGTPDIHDHSDLGPNQDPRLHGKRPELKDKVIVPDVRLQSHMASIGMTFYDGSQFPNACHFDAFSLEHDSWNRARRVGSKVIRVPMNDGKPTGEYEDFLVGFVTKEGSLHRPIPRIKVPSIT